MGHVGVPVESPSSFSGNGVLMDIMIQARQNVCLPPHVSTTGSTASSKHIGQTHIPVETLYYTLRSYVNVSIGTNTLYLYV